VNSFDDPTDGTTYDFGVQSYLDYLDAKAFFEKWGFPVQDNPRITYNKTQYIDFKTGEIIEDYIPPARDAQSEALNDFLQLVEKYDSLLIPTYDGFINGNESKEVPDELLLDFKSFAIKHNLEAALPIIFEVTGLGSGDFLGDLTISAMQTFGTLIAESFVGGRQTFVPVSGRNQNLYDAIAKAAGDNVWYKSEVVKSTRRDDGVILKVKTPKGTKTVEAKRLLIAIPPIIDNMKVFDLDDEEREVFSTFEYSKVHCGIVRHPSLPECNRLDNTPAAAAPSNYTAFPDMPFVGRFDCMKHGSNNFRVMVMGEPPFNQKDAVKEVHKAVRQMAKAGTIKPLGDEEVEIVAWADHGFQHLHVSAEDYRDGFIPRFLAQRGKRNTYYSGAAWSAHFTTMVWAANEVMYPKLLAGLKK
jgi:hypothetical protein